MGGSGMSLHKDERHGQIKASTIDTIATDTVEEAGRVVIMYSVLDSGSHWRCVAQFGSRLGQENEGGRQKRDRDGAGRSRRAEEEAKPR
ncbi:hypothetical protein A0H81_07756 [Grifola frondosa]|uniref:Uncharacterized protein n=1 Tax=Grifola frondosa TaxID=5627 RepID=A0A1C7M607_GRIFR|nr:hypothetical protein A0H81_07756 [Grifola frondosa]